MARQSKEHTIYSDDYDRCVDENGNYDADLAEIFYQDEQCNLNTQLDGRVVAIADLGFWNGRRKGYAIGTTNLNCILSLGSQDTNKVYCDSYNVYKTASHHDGTHYIMFRELREDRNVERFLDKIYNGKDISNRVLNYYTKSLRPYIKKVYGV